MTDIHTLSLEEIQFLQSDIFHIFIRKVNLIFNYLEIIWQINSIESLVSL